MGRPIDADALMKALYHRAFETDGATMWQSGCWVRYRAIEQVVKEQPAVEPERNTDALWDALSEVYNTPGLPDRVYEIVGDVMLKLHGEGGQE